MPAGQRESCLIVVYGSLAPVFGIVTFRAVRAKCSQVRVVVPVARIAFRGCTSIYPVQVTGVAGYDDMRSRKGERGPVVIDGRLCPVRRIMTCCTTCAQGAVMLVVYPVAGITILGCIFEDSIDVAGVAGRGDVPSGQWKSGQVMVHDNLFPVGRIMAKSAVRAQSARVSVVIPVAAIAVSRRVFQSGDGFRPRMAKVTDCVGVFAFQRERHLVVVEILAIGVQAIVTAQALLTEVGGMARHESRIDLTVA